MDQQEVARALGELERKLQTLEETLSGIAGSSAEDAPGQAGDPEPLGVPGRIVDEAVEGPDAAAGARPAVPGAPEPAPAGPPPPAPGAPEHTAAAPAPVARGDWSTPAAPPRRLERDPAAPGPGARPPEPPRAALAAEARGKDAGIGAPDPAALLRFRERLESTARELTRDYDRLLGRLSYAAVPSSLTTTISFARGVPSLDIIDVEGLREAAVRAFDSDPGGATAYGTAGGYPRLRNWIAERHGVEPERVLVTNGSLQADAFLFDHLVGAGDEVVVESPTYDRTLLSLRHRGARVHAVELEPDGIDTAALERLLAGGADVRLAHIIPNFQNPAGYTLSLEKRRQLVGLAARYGFHILEDDPYADLRFSGEPLPTMLSMDSERVVYASSFTKTVCPGVRVGYLVGPTDLVAAVARLATNTYISPGMTAEAIVYEFCASGALERSIETVRLALAERANVLCEALRRELPEAEFVRPQGGYFLWVTLPPGTDVEALFGAAAERGVAFVKGSDFLLDGEGNTLRLAYSGVTVDEIEAGVARLADAYRSL